MIKGAYFHSRGATGTLACHLTWNPVQDNEYGIPNQEQPAVHYKLYITENINGKLCIGSVTRNIHNTVHNMATNKQRKDWTLKALNKWSGLIY